MKKSKKNYIAIVLIVLLLALAVGYAAFSSQLTISGTANAKAGTWDVKFTNASATSSIVANTTANSANVNSTDATKVDVVVNLATPGDGSTVTATITNNGTVDAKLKDFNVEGLTKVSETVYQTGAIKVTVPTVTKNGTDVIAKGASKTFTFLVEWDSGVTEEIVGTSGQTANFTITFDYEQNGVGTFTPGTPSFN